MTCDCKPNAALLYVTQLDLVLAIHVANQRSWLVVPVWPEKDVRRKTYVDILFDEVELVNNIEQGLKSGLTTEWQQLDLQSTGKHIFFSTFVVIDEEHKIQNVGLVFQDLVIKK